MKKMQFFIGITLLVQAASSVFLVIYFLYKNKKNTAGAFSALGFASGLVGGLMVYKQVHAQIEDSRLAKAIEAICDEEKTDEEDALPEIPLDDTADETEFAAGI